MGNMFLEVVLYHTLSQVHATHKQGLNVPLKTQTQAFLGLVLGLRGLGLSRGLRLPTHFLGVILAFFLRLPDFSMAAQVLESCFKIYLNVSRTKVQLVNIPPEYRNPLHGAPI